MIGFEIHLGSGLTRSQQFVKVSYETECSVSRAVNNLLETVFRTRYTLHPYLLGL